jgi:ferritin
MVSDKMAEALNKQINAEMYSSYLYLSMASYFEAKNFNGFAHWMEAQSAEEYGHALKIYKYLNEPCTDTCIFLLLCLP